MVSKIAKQERVTKIANKNERTNKFRGDRRLRNKREPDNPEASPIYFIFDPDAAPLSPLPMIASSARSFWLFLDFVGLSARRIRSATEVLSRILAAESRTFKKTS